MLHTCVLVYLAKEVLAVDQVEWPAEEPVELQTESLEMFLLRLDRVANDLLLDPAGVGAETLPYAVQCSGPGDHELILVAVQHLRIVQVDRELEGEEPSH